MEKVEIKYNKAVPIFLGILTISMFVITYFIYFSGNYENRNVTKIIYVFLLAYLGFTIYKPTKKLLKREAVLIFSKSEIEINQWKQIKYEWSSISDWKIEKENDVGTHYLTIESGENRQKINISWLEKRPEEIEIIIKNFMSK